MTDTPKCEICGEPMPAGEEMFLYHGRTGPCPKPPLQRRPEKKKIPGLMWAVGGTGQRDVMMRFDTPEQAHAFVAGIEADETPNKELSGSPTGESGGA